MVKSGSEPIVGWRLWRVHDDGLQSWVVSHTWQPGHNRARCLAERPDPCPTCPGRACHCGFWALWSPSACIRKAQAYPTPERRLVMGLMVGWGSVALHGDEGFRAQYARALCLFSDWPWERRMRLLTAGAARRWVMRRVGPIGRRLLESRDQSERRAALAATASRYGIPALPLEEALHRGVLTELGVGQAALDELHDMFASLPSDWPRGGRAARG